MKFPAWLLLFALSSNLLAQKDVDLFDDTLVHDIRLTMEPSAWQGLRDSYLLDDYFHADFAWQGVALKEIGIKSRGAGSRSPHKPNLTVKFNKYSKQKLLGHNTILLKANNQDGSMLREFLTMGLMRRLGLPAPREAPARLYINGEFWGLYTIVEDADEDFLDRVFGESSGYLYDFSPILDYHFTYLGDDPARYETAFEAKTHEDAPEWGKLMEMLRAVNSSGTEPAAYVELAGLMKLLAVENYMSDSDGILSDIWGMNNFYLYRPAASKQFRFIPWDADFTMYWSSRPVLHALDSTELTRRALAIPAMRRVYLETLLQAATVADGWLSGEIDRMTALIGVDARRDPHKQCLRNSVIVSCNASDFEREIAGIREFAAERFDEVQPQMVSMLDTPQPEMAAGGVVNAATHLVGLVPGSLGVIYGSSMSRAGESAETWPLPLTLGEVSVNVNGVAAPLLFVSPQQINFQVPWNLPVGPAKVDVTVDGIAAPAIPVALVHAAPGIFGVWLEGDYLSILATGLGPVSPRAQDGEAASADSLAVTLETVTATLNGVPLEVLFAGLAPGYAGVYQVNVKLGGATGDLVLRVAGQSSPPFRVSARP